MLKPRKFRVRKIGFRFRKLGLRFSRFWRSSLEFHVTYYLFNVTYYLFNVNQVNDPKPTLCIKCLHRRCCHRGHHRLNCQPSQMFWQPDDQNALTSFSRTSPKTSARLFFLQPVIYLYSFLSFAFLKWRPEMTHSGPRSGNQQVEDLCFIILNNISDDL